MFKIHGREQKKMKQKRIYILIIVIMIFSAFYFFTNNTDSKVPQSAKKGRIDLSQWDFEKDGIISLDGEWEYYEGQLLNPEDFTLLEGQEPELTGYVKLTSSRKLWTVEKLPRSKGIKTYRLIITTNSAPQLLGLR